MFLSPLLQNCKTSCLLYLLSFGGVFDIEGRNGVIVCVSQPHILQNAVAQYFSSFVCLFSFLTSRGTRARKRKVSPSGSCSMLAKREEDERRLSEVLSFLQTVYLSPSLVFLFLFGLMCIFFGQSPSPPRLLSLSRTS